MKKLFIILILLLLACGCSNADNSNARLSEEKDTIYFEYDGKKYTKNDVFQRLKAQSVESTIETLVAKQALVAEGFDFESKKEEYGAQYDMVVSIYGEEMVSQYYGDKDSFIKMCELNDAPNIYITNYVENRLADFLTKYPSEYIEYINTSDKAKATKLQKLVAGGASFEEACEKVNFENGETTITNVISTEDTTFPESVNEEYKKLEVGKVSSVIEYVEEVETTDETADTENTEPTVQYYVIRLISKDAENDYKDDFISYVVQNEGITSIFDVLDEDHKVNFYDDDFMYTYNKLTK